MIEMRKQGEIAIVEVDNPPVNALGHAVRKGLHDAFIAIGSDPTIAAVVLTCKGRTFFAGADIREFNQPPEAPHLPDVINLIEACSKPVVAAIHGTALGGGFEVALGCHYRVADAKARVGLPEIKLGLLPGAGGTQRLPRAIGPVAALELILSGDPIGMDKAARLGVVDAIAEDDLLAFAVSFVNRIVEEGRPLRRLSEDDTLLAPVRTDMSQFDEAAQKLLARRAGLDAPKACVEAVRNAMQLPFPDGLRAERAAFMALRDGEQSAAQRHYFFAERAAAKVKGVGKDDIALPIAKAAVIGAGTMGAGIAMSFANADIAVTLIDMNSDTLAKALKGIEANYARSSSADTAATARRMALIATADSLQGAAQADLVVEAVFEDMALKKKIFAELDATAPAHAILASNTSTLDVAEIATATGRPTKIAGMHFFSPANVMRLVEIVRTPQVSAETLATLLAVSYKIGKIPVAVGICYGFVGNRMLYARSRQVEALLLEGASPSQIDQAMTNFGFAMGPCAVSDLAGIDVGWRARKQAGLSAAVGDRLAELGRYGQKTGKGYYLYPEGARRGSPDPEVDAIIAGIAAEKGIQRREVTESEIRERLIYAMVNEGARILEEGIAARASDIDVVWVNGYGFPVWRGGPMFFAERTGMDEIATRLMAYANATGDTTLEPAPLLARLAAEAGANKIS